MQRPATTNERNIKCPELLPTTQRFTPHPFAMQNTVPKSSPA